MRTSLAVLASGAALCAGIVALAYGLRPAAETGVLLLGLGLVWLALAHALSRRRLHLGSLRRQFALGIAVVVSVIVAAVVAFALEMFVSDEDAVLIVLSTVFAGLIAVRVAQLLAGGVLRDVESLRDGLVAFADGDRGVKVQTSGADELAELADEANATLKRLAATERARRDLVAAASHDLRTPLTSIRLLAQAIDDDLVDAETRRRYLTTMSTHIEALGGLIEDLFELSRLEAGDIEWSMERVVVGELVQDTVAAMRVHAEAHRVSVRADVGAGAAVARANPERLQRVLFNLIQNAIRHTPTDGSITVRAECVPERIEIEVADTGTGIAEPERERVFEPFFRGGNDQARAGEGGGLGLAISRAIVEAHGGEIWLAGNGCGTRVRFSLPRAPVPTDGSPEAAARNPAARMPRTPRGGAVR
jgi:signal transduction histidine kinase